MRYLFVLTLLLSFSHQAGAAAPTATLPKATQVSVHKIWDQAPHNAFTDLIFWKDRFFCAFREGRQHVSTDGKIRVLSSPDGETWTSAASLALEGFDLRDAGLSVTPDGRLMLNGGAAPRKADGEGAPTGTFVSFSEDGKTWSEPKITLEPGRWMWRVTWHDGKAYGVAYASVREEEGDRWTHLMVSDDGVDYKQLAPKMFGTGWPTEATLRFAKDDTMYCLQRRDDKPQKPSAFFGVSRPPYQEWTWHDLGKFVGGPNFIQLPSGEWLAAGRIYPDPKKPVTALCALDVDKPSMEPILTLPSGGDSSYPGLVWHEGLLYMSYYSSHEGKTNVYLAKIKIE